MYIIKIDNKLYDTTIENDRRFIGLYYEEILFKDLQKIYTDRIIHSSLINPHIPFDYLLTTNKTKYIIEVKSRIGIIINHKYMYIDCKKIDEYKKLIDEYKNNNYETIIIFIFQFINDNDDNKLDRYYYMIDYDNIKNDCKLSIVYYKKTYLLPIDKIKRFEELINIIGKY
jgi:hypothetical protein